MYVLNRTVDGSVRYGETICSCGFSLSRWGPQAGGNGLVNRGAPIIILITALKYKNSVFLLRLPSVICLLCIALILWENAISQVAKIFEFPESRGLILVYILPSRWITKYNNCQTWTLRKSKSGIYWSNLSLYETILPIVLCALLCSMHNTCIMHLLSPISTPNYVPCIDEKNSLLPYHRSKVTYNITNTI